MSCPRFDEEWRGPRVEIAVRGTDRPCTMTDLDAWRSDPIAISTAVIPRPPDASVTVRRDSMMRASVVTYSMRVGCRKCCEPMELQWSDTETDARAEDAFNRDRNSPGILVAWAAKVSEAAESSRRSAEATQNKAAEALAQANALAQTALDAFASLRRSGGVRRSDRKIEARLIRQFGRQWRRP